MKTTLNFTLFRFAANLIPVLSLFASIKMEGQICASPATVIYGLTGNGAIYPINVSNASLGSVVKNTTYSGNSVSKSNGLAYNSTNGKFYYFKRNVGSSPQEFVSYDPGTATVSILASSTCNSEVHTGCITADGLYYYTIDVSANLNRYNILTNTWVKLTSSFTDQFGNNVSTVIQNQSAGDIAFDGNGNLWIVTSSNSNYGVYMLPAPMPTLPVAGVTVSRRVNPTTATPSNNSIAGIAFNPSGQIFMSTRGDDRLYRLENNLSLTYLGTFPLSDIGNDMTSCAFPLGVLPVTWLNFTAASNRNNEVELNWQVAEKNNTGFNVQHSTDGITWKDISFIPTNASDMEEQSYFYKHSNPVPGKNYYRIKTRSDTGKDSYTEVKTVMIKSGSGSITLWPNPASSTINFETGNPSVMKIRVLDLAGRIQLDIQKQAGENTLNISSLKPGTYILNIYTVDGVSQNQKFVKH